MGEVSPELKAGGRAQRGKRGALMYARFGDVLGTGRVYAIMCEMCRDGDDVDDDVQREIHDLKAIFLFRI